MIVRQSSMLSSSGGLRILVPALLMSTFSRPKVFRVRSTMACTGVFVAHVDLDFQNLDAIRLPQLGRRFSGFCLVASGNRKGRPGFRQTQRHAAAEAAVAPRYDRHLTAQIEQVYHLLPLCLHLTTLLF